MPNKTELLQKIAVLNNYIKQKDQHINKIKQDREILISKAGINEDEIKRLKNKCDTIAYDFTKTLNTAITLMEDGKILPIDFINKELVKAYEIEPEQLPF